MKRDENKRDADLQRNIEEQEQAMAALLRRVMEDPLRPLHDTLGELRTQLGAVQQANAKAALAVEAGLSEALDEQGKRLKRQFDNVIDGIDGFKEELGTLASVLDKHHTGQAERNERMQDSLNRADGVLAGLDAKADAGVDALGAVRMQHQATGDSLAAAANAITKVDADLGTLNGLAQQFELQQARLGERIDTLQPGLASRFESLAAMIDSSAREAARRYDALSDTQQALVTASVQEQLALQLAPFQARTRWLFALSGLSFAATLALLGVQLLR